MLHHDTASQSGFLKPENFHGEPDECEMCGSPNHLQITDGGIKLVLREYKTAKTMGAYINELPEDLCTVLRHHLKDGRGYLFTGRGGEQFQSTPDVYKLGKPALAASIEEAMCLDLVAA